MQHRWPKTYELLLAFRWCRRCQLAPSDRTPPLPFRPQVPHAGVAQHMARSESVFPTDETSGAACLYIDRPKMDDCATLRLVA